MFEGFCDPSGLLNVVDFQLFKRFVDLKPQKAAIITSFYVGEFDFTKTGY
mgnify:CR=1 FL=1